MTHIYESYEFTHIQWRCQISQCKGLVNVNFTQYTSYDETLNSRILYFFRFQVYLELVFGHRKILSVPMGSLKSENLFLCISHCILHFRLYLDKNQD